MGQSSKDGAIMDELLRDNYRLSQAVLALIQDITGLETTYGEWAADRAVTVAGGQSRRPEQRKRALTNGRSTRAPRRQPRAC